MKRLTCDDPQDNFLTMMNYVFSKGGWACIRHDGENEDVPLTDWAKVQCAKCEYEISVGDTPQEIDETLCECLMDGEGCPVALAYCFACQAVNLRTRLKAIEDILGEDYDLDQLRWRSCKKEKPTEMGLYEAVQTRLSGAKTRVTIAMYDPSYDDYGWEYTNITHWRPLPEPPKEESV